jgi:hypothetical protein
MRLVVTVLVLAACEPAAAPPTAAPLAPAPAGKRAEAAPAAARVAPGPPAHPAPLTATKLAAPSPGAGPIGTPHPLVLVAAADSGRWVVACQARVDTDGDKAVRVRLGHHGDIRGDAMVGYLIRGTGAGTPIERFVGSSSDGRWIAAIADGALRLVDDATSQSFALAGADLRDDENPGESRVAAFDGSGARLVYFRAGNDRRIVVRDLAAATERDIDLPDGVVWRVEPDPAGRWARLLWIRRDGDGNGTLGWPQMMTSAARGMCLGPAMSWSSHGARGDEPDHAWLDLETGDLLDDASVVRPLGAVPLVRAADGALRRGDETWASAACAARVLAAQESPPRAVIACTKGATAGTLALVGKDLNVAIDVPADDLPDEDSSLLMVDTVTCFGPEHCIDVADGKRLPLPGSVTALGERGWLVKTATGLVAGDIGGTATTPIDAEGYPHVRAGDVVAVGTTIVDVGKQKRLGRVARSPVAVDTAGRGLVPASGDADSGIASGPLRWEQPR